MKKTITMLIITLFVSVNMFADGITPEGTGTIKDPYQIESLDNLLWMSTNSESWNQHFIQTANIDANHTKNWDSAFLPIGGHDSKKFTGTYNGQEYLIQNFYMCNSDIILGFFGVIEYATIKNVRMTFVHIEGYSNLGGLIGVSKNSTIENCHISGKVKGDYIVGGLIGRSYRSKIIDCEVYCNVFGGRAVGGIIGYDKYPNSIITSSKFLGGILSDDEKEKKKLLDKIGGGSYAALIRYTLYHESDKIGKQEKF